MHKYQHKIFFFFSLLICILIFISSYESLIHPDFYNKESLNWQAQSIGQDAMNLFLICPFLLITAFLILSRKEYAHPLWAGTLVYLIYTYQIYCFNIHFNSFFVVYCLILGLCFYLFVFYTYWQIKSNLIFDNGVIYKIVAFYLLTIAILFYLLWLWDVIPAILHHTVPESVMKGGLVSNPVQVLDLSLFLPGVFITGLLLLKKKPLGQLFSPVLLTFFVLMDLTIASLNIVMVNKGVDSGYTVAKVMSSLAVLSVVLLTKQLNHIYRSV